MNRNLKPSGFLLINKPVGPTSHDVINQLRKITGIKKVGHAGTLDPFAGGVLLVAVGREATRRISRLVKLDKKYIATLYLGATSDTYDNTGSIVKSKNIYQLDMNKIKAVLKRFIGKQRQVPPMYSAKKVKGKKLYELARKGIEVERQPVEIHIFKIKLIKFQHPLLTTEVHCSSGTYIRSLANDIGNELGCGAYLKELKRTQVGKYKLSQASDLKDITKDNWQELMFDI
jgi:tRNA pseudouridine55 synthase